LNGGCALFRLSLIAETDSGGLSMYHKGVEFTLWQVDEGRWEWRFQIGKVVKTGSTRTRLIGMAAHRVQQKIDSELKELRYLASSRLDPVVG
jgi:hypothetical protein